MFPNLTEPSRSFFLTRKERPDPSLGSVLTCSDKSETSQKSFGAKKLTFGAKIEQKKKVAPQPRTARSRPN